MTDKMSNEEKRKFLDKKVGEKMVIKIARPGLIIETKTVSITHSLIDLYLEEKIDYVFIKGTAMLLGGYFTDIGERMIGDIDFLVNFFTS